MIILIYGNDGYRVSQKTKEYTNIFQQKHGAGLGFKKFDLKEKSGFEDLKRFFETSPMFASKKLAVADNFFNNLNIEKLEEFLKKSDIVKSQESFLLISEAQVKDIKEKGKKLLDLVVKKAEQKQEYKSFKNFAEAKVWLKKEFKDFNIEDSALSLLFDAFGTDTWRLSSELKKLNSYKPNEKITKADVLEMSVLEAHSNIFEIFDSFFEKDKKKSLYNFEEAIHSGIEEGMLFNLLIDQIRTAVYLVLGREKELDCHPYKLQKIKAKLKNFKREQLLELYDELAEIDLAVKIGKLDYITAFERIILSI
jgi:DNA polymerase III delta subunit